MFHLKTIRNVFPLLRCFDVNDVNKSRGKKLPFSRHISIRDNALKEKVHVTLRGHFYY